jgi:hypothetical protein
MRSIDQNVKAVDMFNLIVKDKWGSEYIDTDTITPIQIPYEEFVRNNYITYNPDIDNDRWTQTYTDLYKLKFNKFYPYMLYRLLRSVPNKYQCNYPELVKYLEDIFTSNRPLTQQENVFVNMLFGMSKCDEALLKYNFPVIQLVRWYSNIIMGGCIKRMGDSFLCSYIDEIYFRKMVDINKLHYYLSSIFVDSLHEHWYDITYPHTLENFKIKKTKKSDTSIISGDKVAGGTAIGPYTFKDGQTGYIVVPSSSVFVNKKYGYYNTHIDRLGLAYRDTNSNWTDPYTGLYNTQHLCTHSGNDSYTTPNNNAAHYCNNLVHDGCDDYFLPNKDELCYICKNKDLLGIDWTSFNSSYVWSSSQGNSDTDSLGVDENSEVHCTYRQGHHYGVIPVRRILID